VFGVRSIGARQPLIACKIGQLALRGVRCFRNTQQMIGIFNGPVKIRPDRRLIRSTIGTNIALAPGHRTLDRGEIAGFKPAKASPKEAQSFPDLRPIATLVFAET
jgi:hypothetical protein